jgi:hypothetical protein
VIQTAEFVPTERLREVLVAVDAAMALGTKARSVEYFATAISLIGHRSQVISLDAAGGRVEASPPSLRQCSSLY